MSSISEWSTKEEENTHLDDLSLSGEGGQYINKVMCAVKSYSNSTDDDIANIKEDVGDANTAIESISGKFVEGILSVASGGSGHGEYPERSVATDFNTYTSRGEYHVKFSSTTQNAPVTPSTYLDCILIVKRIDSFSDVTSSKRTIQIAIVINSTHNTLPKIYIRKGFVESWSAWSEIAYVSGD